MKSKELRNKWLKFYEDRGHINIGAVSLIGDGTTGVMFNVAGMQPLMPYLLGKAHPSGKKRLTNIQGCVRTVDIEEVGDQSHFTFFEMMGNWSLGDYFKKEKTQWTFDFLTKELGLDANKICASVFAGDKTAPRDEETAELLVKVGIKKENIYFLPKKDNWWELDGTVNTPCGPDNEWFYPLYDEPCSDKCDITCDCPRWVEIGNDVYMQYKKVEKGYVPLENKNVDTGFGFERTLMFINGLTDGYKTDIFVPVINHIEKALKARYGENEDQTRSMRIIADHVRTSVMLIGDINGIVPSNVGAGYILRRLIRRAVRHAKKIGLELDELLNVAKIYIEEIYNEAYPLLVEKENYILETIKTEMDKFNRALSEGLKEFDKVLEKINKHIEFAKLNGEVVEKVINGKTAFRLYDTYGFPLELTIEMAKERGFSVDSEGFNAAFSEHQEKSKGAAKGEFKSGLSDTGEITTKYHTATHLLNAALKIVVDKNCHQKGSNITPERLRFDFNCDHKLEESEIKKLEEIINGWIKADLVVTKETMPKQKAVSIGAEHEFLDKYPDEVSVYFIGDVSKEICTGPHVTKTSELGHFKIAKEESCGAGLRRIKAILE